MTELRLEHPQRQAIQLIKDSLEHTNGINEYHEQGNQVVAKTNAGFPRILWSYGETLYIDINEGRESDVTPIEITGEKDVSVNIGANPEKFKRRFIEQLQSRRDNPVNDSPTTNPSRNEVESSRDLSDGKSSLTKVLIIGLIFTSLMYLWILSMMP